MARGGEPTGHKKVSEQGRSCEVLRGCSSGAESQENRPGEAGMEVVGGAQGRGPVPSSNAVREERTWEETGAAKQRGGVLRGAQLLMQARQFGELGLCAVGNRKPKNRSLVQGREVGR